MNEAEIMQLLLSLWRWRMPCVRDKGHHRSWDTFNA